ncbi:hypothetical protein AB8E30_09420 [Bacillus manliponensis]|uniref:DUF7660 family protein n=1 Tax=Bacillus manliponensis TaxID=574376 RepID=UPI003A660E83
MLVKFLSLLQRGFKENNEEWKNTDVESYLESLQAWINDCDGYYKNTGETIPKNIPWNFIAQVLFAAAYYE